MTGRVTAPPADRVLAAVGSLTAALGQPPTLRELAAEVGLAVSTTHHHVLRLLREGRLVAEKRRDRYLRRADERSISARAVFDHCVVTATFTGDLDALSPRDAAFVRDLLDRVEARNGASS